MAVDWEPRESELLDSRLDSDFDEMIMTVRIKVPGGWLYRSTVTVAQSVAICQTFVPHQSEN
jgi:hypothetical protein